MPPPNAPSIDITQDSKSQKYIKSYEEPLEEGFKIEVKFSGLETQPNPYFIGENSQFFPLSTNNEQYVASLGISPYHPICCKVNRMIDSGIERKQIEQYISGQAQLIIYVTQSLAFFQFIFDLFLC